ncbi:MAG: hypothetical protein F6K00_02545 [Leptolyngbya sp. SIOISBB]|nr:hypothetical protein [Leptolyngbya sp. SIOISBB]
MNFSPEKHPKQSFLFFIDDEINELKVSKMKLMISEITDKYNWINGAPKFVDDCQEFEDGDFLTIGGELEIYSALPPWGDRLPKEVDTIHLNEVKILINYLEKYSKETDSTISIEIDGTQIGWIENGISDTGITETLLMEWEKILKERE